jgi:hypothetical protein
LKGAGKDFFLECARDFELTGTWVDDQTKQELKIGQGKWRFGDAQGTYENVRGEKEGSGGSWRGRVSLGRW